jgi:hypothetical protein
MEGIGHQRQRVHRKAGGQLNDEEQDIDGQHHLDARRLGPRHPVDSYRPGARRSAASQKKSPKPKRTPKDQMDLPQDEINPKLTRQ